MPPTTAGIQSQQTVASNGMVQCILCGHSFHPGNTGGFVYCAACGRRFNPRSPLDETVIASATDSAAPAGEEPIAGDAPPAGASRRFGDYDIVDEIARGGMGVVYLARQRVLKRVVALKVLRSGDNASVEERERLLREAKAAAGLSHPNIVPIHEFSIHQGQPYFTMDFIEGQPLDRVLEKGPLHTREAVVIIETVARAISYAHARGIIHRDLKPANIIINPDGRPMITDFGLAVQMSREEDEEKQKRMTLAGCAMGTIPYAPPEQAAGKIDQITERSDVYAMGAVLYETVTGRPPFTGFTQFELMRRVINQDPVPPRQLTPKVHRDVETIILKCLEKDPRRRYVSAKAFADDCQSFLKGEVIAARPATLAYRCKRFLQRRPLLTFLSACVVVLSLAVWTGIDHFRALAKEKEATEQALEVSLAAAERIAMEKEETEKQVRREWRTEYNINFDYAFRWEADMEKSHRFELPWLNPKQARLLADPPRLALADTESQGGISESPLHGKADLGFPFSIPRDVRITLRLQTPAEQVGELLIMLDVDRNYQPHLGTTAIRFGSYAHPGAAFYRSETVLAEAPAFALKPGTQSELVLERADDKLKAYLDGKLVLESDDPPAMFNADNGRMTIDVKDGTLEFFDLAVELRGMSRNLVASLLEIANTMAARGRADLAHRLYINVLLEPTDAQNRLRAVRGYARSLWQTLNRRDRGVAGIQGACTDLNAQLQAANRVRPGELDYLIALALSFNPSTAREGTLALERLDRAAAVAYSAGSEADSEYGDLAKLETMFVYLRMGMLGEAARRFSIMHEDGTTNRLYDKFGAELGGGGQAALLLEKIDPLIRGEEDLDTAAALLRAAAAISPTSRECANRFRRLSRVLERHGDSAKAVEYMHWAERLSPDWFRPYLDEAQIQYSQGNAGRAEEALERARAAIPQSLELQLGVAKMYLDELPPAYQDAAKAEEAARSAIALSQNRNPAAQELCAFALARLGKLDEALSMINSAIELESTEARIKFRDELALKVFSNRHNEESAK